MTRSICWRLALVAALPLSACQDTEPTALELNGPPAVVTIVAGNGQTGPAGEPLAQDLAVLVQDAQGRGVPAVAVQWTASGGSLSAAVDSTDEDGLASVRWTMPGAPGNYTAEARVAGLSVLQFAATAVPAVPLVFRYLDAGSYHSCGITTSEELYCWGYNGDGQAGNGAGAASLTPQKVERPERFRAVSGGRYHTCGITLSGEVVCWGASRDSRTAGGGPATYQYVQAGELFSCGITLAKGIWCWGWNLEGEMGRVTLSQSATADTTTLPRGWPANTPIPRYRSVAGGAMHACGIVQEGPQAGRAYCWGYGRDGQLGIGPTPFAPDLIGIPALDGPIIADSILHRDRRVRPTLVSNAITFRADPFTIVPPPPDPAFPLPEGPYIAAGFAHTCAIAQAANQLYCWGLNESGQLGNGASGAGVVSNTPVAVSTPAQLVRITAGNSHTCGLTAAGQVYCWGNNTYGQLGDGTTSNRTTPTLVTGTGTGSLIFAYVKAAEMTTCGLTTTGVGYCWGNNEYGQLGDGTTTNANVPRKVALQP